MLFRFRDAENRDQCHRRVNQSYFTMKTTMDHCATFEMPAGSSFTPWAVPKIGAIFFFELSKEQNLKWIHDHIHLLDLLVLRSFILGFKLRLIDAI